MIKKYCLIAWMLLGSSGVFASEAIYPQRPVKLIISNGPGGPVDLMTRLLADKLGEKWKQPVVIENRPGASGIIATTALARAKPDGYTLGMVVASTVTIVPFAVDSLPFDPRKDLQPISIVARTPFVFVVPSTSQIKTWQDFVDLAKTKEISIGSFSIGTAFHLVWEQIAERAGIKGLYVPSSNAGKTQSDLIGGMFDIALDAPSSAKGMIDSGRLRALAVTGAKRFSGLPDTPTLQEAGLKDYATEPWIGLMAPAGVSSDIVTQVQRDLSEIMKDPDIARQMHMLGMVPEASTPDELNVTIESDREQMEFLVKKLGIKLN